MMDVIKVYTSGLYFGDIIVIYANEENTVRIRKELCNIGARYFYYLEKWKSPIKLLFWEFGGKWQQVGDGLSANICEKPAEVVSIWVQEHKLKKV